MYSRFYRLAAPVGNWGQPYPPPPRQSHFLNMLRIFEVTSSDTVRMPASFRDWETAAEKALTNFLILASVFRIAFLVKSNTILSQNTTSKKPEINYH